MTAFASYLYDGTAYATYYGDKSAYIGRRADLLAPTMKHMGRDDDLYESPTTNEVLPPFRKTSFLPMLPICSPPKG